MRGIISVKRLTFVLFIAILVWCSEFETCNARTGKHGRQNTESSSVSLSKQIVIHHGSKSKLKAPPPPPKVKPPPPPPKAKPPPPPPKVRPPPPTPKVKPPPPPPKAKPPPPPPKVRPPPPPPKVKPPPPLPKAKPPPPHPKAKPPPPPPKVKPPPPPPIVKPPPPPPKAKPSPPPPKVKPPSKAPSTAKAPPPPKGPSPANTPAPAPEKAPPPPKGPSPANTPAPAPAPEKASLPPKGQSPSNTPAPAPEKAPPSPAPYQNVPPSSISTYNVLHFGAKGDGRTDDTKAFQAAWAATCKVRASTIIVPSDHFFLVGPISFFGPYCESNIIFQLDGTIIAPTNSNAWGKGLFQWLEFKKLKGITIRGKGVIDGRGSVWWKNGTSLDDLSFTIALNMSSGTPPAPVSSQLKTAKMPSLKQTALRFYGSYNVTVTGITIRNSPQCHLKFNNCVGVLVYEMNVSSPADSPNTDGIHLQNSQHVLIRNINLACGDDCISIQTGCSNIFVHDVNCGPGHGISIGGLGKDNTKACVSNITVQDIMMHNTTNGVRIKTWQGGEGSVQGVQFSNIQMSEVKLPIVIDQYYCANGKCKNQTSAVSLSGITFEKIWGTYTLKPAHFACSDSLPCIDVTLNSIQLQPIQEHKRLYGPYCWQTYGELTTPTTPPIDCIKLGKPSSNRIQSDHDYC